MFYSKQHFIHELQWSSVARTLEQYEASALATSTDTMKRSFNFSASSLTEQEWSVKVGPQIEKIVREIVEAYNTCGALKLFHGIVTHLYMYAEPVTVMAKIILAMTVHAVAQVVSHLDELGQDTTYELSLEPSLVFVSFHGNLWDKAEQCMKKPAFNRNKPGSA